MLASLTRSNREAAQAAGARCAQCPRNSSESCVAPEPAASGKLKLIVVGESPGREEEEVGRPFVGQSGRLMERTLKETREEVHWTNAILCGGNTSTIVGARKACAPRLAAELADVGVFPTLAAGGYAIQSVLSLPGKPSVVDWHGSVVRQEGRLVYPTVHPTFALRSPEWAPVFEYDCRRTANAAAWTDPAEGKQVIVVRNVGDLRHLHDLADVVSLDVETSYDGAFYCKLLCVGLSDTKRAIVVAWQEFNAEHQTAARDALNECLKTRVAVTQNGPAFDHVVLRRHGVEVNRWEDTILAAHVLAGHMPKRLSHIVSNYIDTPPWKRKPHDDQESLYAYNAKDVIYTRLAWPGLKADLVKTNRERLYEHDKTTALLTRDMQITGIKYDVERSKQFAQYLSEQEVVWNERATTLIGRPINLKSSVQLARVMFGELKAQVYFRSKETGRPVLNALALRAYAAHKSETISKLATITLEHRRVAYTKSHYIDDVQVDNDNRIHPSWTNYSAVTGRWGCSDPNLQNLPKPQNDPTRALGGVRSLFIAKRDHVIVGFDAKQLEMRIAAYVSGDPVMIAACEQSDLHAANAELIWGKEFVEATAAMRKVMRDLAKQSGFAVAYMASAVTVHARIIASGQMISLRQVEEMLKKIKRAFAIYYQWQAKSLADTARRGYVTSPIMGRVRWMGHAPSMTETANFPIQSGAADVFNTRLPLLARKLPQGAQLVAHVYDAGYVECPKELASAVSELAVETFEAPIEIGGRMVKLPLDVHVGERWSEAT